MLSSMVRFFGECVELVSLKFMKLPKLMFWPGRSSGAQVMLPQTAFPPLGNILDAPATL